MFIESALSSRRDISLTFRTWPVEPVNDAHRNTRACSSRTLLRRLSRCHCASRHATNYLRDLPRARNLNGQLKMGMFATVTAAVMADPHCGDGKGRNLVSIGSCTSGNGRAIGTAWGEYLERPMPQTQVTSGRWRQCRTHSSLLDWGLGVAAAIELRHRRPCVNVAL